MRLATIRFDGGTRAVRVEDGTTFGLPFRDVAETLASTSTLHELGEGGEPGPSVESVDFAPLLPAPSKIVCVGLNYRTHILEMGRELPSHPTLFAKFANSLVGAHDPILLPQGSSVDWEAELAVVIGRETRRADPAAAGRAIAGYTIANDVSVRDWQWRTPQWLQGKTFDRTTPLGPYLVTPDEVGAAPDLEITCKVDGTQRQRSRTGDLLFPPRDLVAYVSQIMTLLPGDVILTGTPGGVGAGMEPPVFLAPGQEIVTAIEGLGECVNPCVSEATGRSANSNSQHGEV